MMRSSSRQVGRVGRNIGHSPARAALANGTAYLTDLAA